MSIVNWVAGPVTEPLKRSLDGQPVDHLSTRLTAEDITWDPLPLAQNKSHSFIGAQPTGDGFLLSVSEGERLLADPRHAKRVVPYLNGDDITETIDQTPRRYAIYFGADSLEDSARTPELLEIVRRDVKPHREGRGRHFERLWWQFAWPRPGMWEVTQKLPRYIVSTTTGKRFMATWQPAGVLPSNATAVFTFDDDYSMGVLISRAHNAWA